MLNNIAKDEARKHFPCNYDVASSSRFHTLLRQQWLVRLSTLLSDNRIADDVGHEGDERVEP